MPVLQMSVISVVAEVGERLFAGRWIAGPRIEDALARTRKFNKLGMGTIINYIGEDLKDESAVERSVQTNLHLVEEIRKRRLRASVSLKITQLGLRVSKSLARRNYDRIVAFARRNRVFVWLDAESHDTLDDAISVYGGQVRKKGVGIALQSYLKRSNADLLRLLKMHAVIRLVKGAYKESMHMAYESREQRTHNFAVLMRIMFKHGGEFTIATHDQTLIDEAMALEKRSKARITYAMLNGIRNGYAARLVAEGNRVDIYIPFGTRWVEYAIRRMREESHIILLLRSMLGG